MIAETCPITVRTVTAHLDTGRAVYGEQASAICELPVEAVTIVPESCEDECTSSAGIQGDAQVRLWRIDVNAHAPQPKDRAAAFQEQQAFEPHHAIDVSLTMAGVDSGNDDTMLALYQHKEWWMRPTWVRTPSELPERTQLLLRRNNDAEDAEWLVLVAICGTDIRADFSGQPATESDDTALRLVLSSNRVGRTTLCDTAAYIACASDPYMAIRAATQTAARQLGIRTRKERPFPDALTGLGWCTWDSLGRDVNEQAIVNKMEEFQAKHVPISWVLIDDGWSNTDLGATTAYIGKSFYSVDEYWNGAMDDIKVYRGADLTMPTAVAISGTGVVNNKLTLIEKDSTKLTATVTPDDAVSKNVTWSSSDESVAKVAADGTVTGVKAGTATITATTELGGVKAELPVTVEPMNAQNAAAADLDAAIAALKVPAAENLPLVAKGTKNGSAITWKSSDEKLITSTNEKYENKTTGADDPYRGAGIINRPAYGDGDSKPVTLTATASYNGGEKVTKTIEVTVKEKTRIAPDTGYAAVTFESDSNGGEKAWVASTEKNDFFTFKTRNNGQAVLTNDADTGGLRDMFVLRSHEGDKYYLIATDLKVSSMGWSQNQVNGSRKVEVYESTDMMNWTRTNGDGNGGITINTPNAGMTWAPEAYWDDDLNAYVVFFSSRMFTDDTRTTPVKNDKTGNSSYAQVRYAITRDFVNFTEPQMWQDTGYSRIDSTVRKIGGYYYRFTKNEQGGAAGDYITTGKSIFLERSKVLTAPTTEASPGQDPNTGWQLLEQALLPFEGPETIKLNKDDELNTKDDDGYILLSDNFAYRAFMTTGAELSKTTWDNPMTKRYPDFNNEKKPVKAEPGAQGYITQGANGGLPDKVRHGAFVNVPESVLKVTKSWTAANPTHIEAVDSTTKAVYNAGTRELTATVTAADKGTLAGSVKFSAGDWSKTVKLDAEGKATVTLPASVSGTVAVAYDGYTDGLVNPSDTTVDGIEQGKVDLAELNKQIAAAEALKESDYTADSWAKLAAALKTAKAALAAENQGEVDTAAADLKTAIEALQKAPTNPGEGDGDKGDGNKPTTPTTGDKTNVNKPGSALSNTGTAVLGLGGAVVALAIAGISLTLWRKRRA